MRPRTHPLLTHRARDLSPTLVRPPHSHNGRLGHSALGVS